MKISNTAQGLVCVLGIAMSLSVFKTQKSERIINNKQTGETEMKKMQTAFKFTKIEL